MGRSKDGTLPQTDSPLQLAESFADFYTDKVQKIRDGCAAELTKLPVPNVDPSPALPCSMDSFQAVSQADVLKAIRSAPNKTSSLDVLDVNLLKECPSLIPILTDIVNGALLSGIMPDDVKTAVVTPLLKKANLDVNVLSNYRPVSTLPFLSKLIERMAVSQISEYLEREGLNEPLQSAYRPFHSTETALVRVQSDLLMALDSVGGAAVILLDQSAAFDLIDTTQISKFNFFFIVPPRC